jgi:hypothetical protein
MMTERDPDALEPQEIDADDLAHDVLEPDPDEPPGPVPDDERVVPVDDDPDVVIVDDDPVDIEGDIDV